MEWIRHLGREHPVRTDHRRYVTRLDRDLEVAEAQALEQAHLLQRRLDERLGLIALRDLGKVLRQRAGVRTDPHRDGGALRCPHHLGDLVGSTDVPRVDTHGGHACVDRFQREARVEVDVRDHRNR
jgi:hypothetical protein